MVKGVLQEKVCSLIEDSEGFENICPVPWDLPWCYATLANIGTLNQRMTPDKRRSYT